LESGELGLGVKNAGDVDLMPLGGIYSPIFRGEHFTSTENLHPISLVKPLHGAKKVGYGLSKRKIWYRIAPIW
jgi:hypothetical protein